ncbi:UDP-2,4-diacetamido-2,4,6-trideoxy-beta-L-altropyranose hydrolase [Limnobacter sp.]|uniref:UDP-2,4-diacetamido-2,4, 6-trideoxy-beta-L-altropyranose hydrolase n=1 Tax=Limnobacter sp. TaxID=2003368 RepID=UPI002FE01DF8
MASNAIIAFRVDSSSSMGTGHVMRCLTLAGRLGDMGFQPVFFCANLPGNLTGLIASTYPVEMLGNDSPLKFVELCRNYNPQAVVVDHYQIDHHWESVVQAEIKVPMVVVDDLANRKHECTLLLDQNLGRQSSDYDGLVPASARRLIGTRYALLRPEFAELRPQSLARKLQFDRIARVLISLGGADPTNVTLSVLQQLNSNSAQQLSLIDVVVGNAYPHHRELRAFVGKSSLPIAVHTQVANVGELMLCADLAIGAGGSSAWERCTMGLPSVAIGIAANQTIVLQGLQAAGAALVLLSPAQLHTDFNRCLQQLNHTKTYLEMSEKAATLVDGAGASRVAQSVGALL